MGTVIDIDSDRTNTPRSEYYVAFKADKYGKYQCKYFFTEDELEHTDKQKERDWRLNKLLMKKES